MVARRIGNCRVVDEIGKGGMAIIYRAVQESLDRPVAIKELKPEFTKDEQITERFQREALTIAAFQHENIVHVYDYVARGSAQFIVMEYVDGISLFELLSRVERLPPEVAAVVALQLARALEYAHFRGVVHRDIKPSNVIVSKLGEVKLMDFGIARAEALGDLTRPGVALGTPSYMSPEQIMGERVDWRSDIFSFGIVLYQMLVGRKPFNESEQRTVMQAILKDPYLPPRALFPDIPRRLARLVARCLRKAPEQRFSSTETLRMLLEQFVARQVRINMRSRLVAFLHHRGVLTEAEALTVLTREILSQPRLARTDVSGPTPWYSRVLPVAAAAAIAFGVNLAGVAAAELLPAHTDRGGIALAKARGYLRVNVWPWARVFVDGSYIDTTPFMRALPLAPGRHTIELRNEHFEDERRVVEIEPERTASVTIELTRRRGSAP
ncbi:MAG: serine/threonine protein kinase [Deltaproteobacteria bacterium]|nr:serine/threonine protein kinase [Deltaproteobacteria bacterium]